MYNTELVILIGLCLILGIIFLAIDSGVTAILFLLGGFGIWFSSKVI